jgi:hypothetical protein
VFEQECGVGAVESHGALKASTGMGCWFVLWRRDAGGRFAGEEFGDGGVDAESGRRCLASRRLLRPLGRDGVS